MYTLRDRVRFKPHFPGDTWDTEPWWVCGVITSQHFWQPQPVTSYHVARDVDQQATWVTTCVRPNMLMPWEERYRSEDAESTALDVARKVYLTAKNAAETA